MAVASSSRIDPLSGHEISPDSTEDLFDPLPDETVFKSGWLFKRSRRGVSTLLKFIFSCF